MKPILRFLPILLLYLISCQKEGNLNPVSTVSDTTPAKVLELKSWFEENTLLRGSTPSNQSRTAVANSNPSGQQQEVAGDGVGYQWGYKDAVPEWQHAVAFNYDNGQSAWRVPLHFTTRSKRWTIRLRGTPKSQAQYQLPAPDLLIFKDAENQTHYEVREFEPEQSYSAAHNGKVIIGDYTGRVLFYDWSGNLIRGYQYTAGQPIARIRPLSSTEDNTHTTLEGVMHL